jgi:predicted transcriptional regulator of viral defense system
VETGKALYKAKQSINYERLLEYCKQFDSQAVIKRLGFLLELLKIENPIIDRLQRQKTNSYIQLDTEMPNTGKRLSRWSIQQNIDSETIQSSILT